MNLNKSEVLRYLGYKDQIIDLNTEKLLKECMQEIGEISQKLFVYDTYPIEKTNNLLTLKNTNLKMDSRDILTHLSRSDHCTLMAASLGLDLDRKIAYYAKFNLGKSLILDACASAAIELVCDEVESKVRLQAREHGYNITSRFSPGYGDLPLTMQKELANILKTYPKIGLSVTESSILLPRKSVTAIIGWQKDKCNGGPPKCNLCLKKDCLYRKGGNNNEY